MIYHRPNERKETITLHCKRRNINKMRFFYSFTTFHSIHFCKLKKFVLCISQGLFFANQGFPNILRGFDFAILSKIREHFSSQKFVHSRYIGLSLCKMVALTKVQCCTPLNLNEHSTTHSHS